MKYEACFCINKILKLLKIKTKAKKNMNSVKPMNTAFSGNALKSNILSDFVSPQKIVAVPNHLLDTKIFHKLKQNASTKIDPSVVHFEGFQLNKTIKRTIKICNASSERQNLHIVPPATKYFSIIYTKPRRFVAGFTIDVTIKFTADEWRYYYDCIRVHCKGDENLIIPLHAYPVMDASNFPKKFVFSSKSIVLGQTQTKTLPLRSNCPVDFEFQLTVAQSHPALSVHPLSGTVPGEGETAIVVTFTPKEYATAHMTMILNVSQFNAQPLTCNVTASCSPANAQALHKSVKDLDEMFLKTKILDPRLLSPMQISRKRRKARPIKAEKIKEIERDGLFFPTNINNQHAVNSVLNQKAGKLRAKDVREAVMSKLKLQDDEAGIPLKSSSSRQMKEATFKQAIRQDQMEERANQLRWQVRRGYNALSDEEHVQILRDREDAMDVYRYKKLHHPNPYDEVRRTKSECLVRRTIRTATINPNMTPGFDLYKNNPWLVRHRALTRFQQAARTILIRNRADHKVRMLRQMIKDFQSGIISVDKPSKSSNLDVRSNTAISHPDNNGVILDMNSGSVQPFTFPVYVESESKDDITTDKLGSVEFAQTNISIRHNIPFQDLKVPQQYKLMSYSFADIQGASRNYVQPGLIKPLRTGADDEIIQVSVPHHLFEGKEIPKDFDDSTSDIKSLSGTTTTATEKSYQNESTGLIMPSGMLKNPVYHPLHIFNPVPGLQRYYLPFGQTEVDPDFHLCPIPRYTRLPNAKSFLDDNDIIKGIMTWKDFPSQAAIVMSQQPIVSESSLPRWSDPFSEAMIPHVTPNLLQNLPEDETENLLENSNEDGLEDAKIIELTPAMVEAQFPVEEQLRSAAAEVVIKTKKSVSDTEFVKKKFDVLGSKIRDTLKKLDQMDKDKPKLSLW